MEPPSNPGQFTVWPAGVTGRSQIFLELGGGSPVEVDFEPSIELAHRYTKPISARARPRKVRHLGSEFQGLHETQAIGSTASASILAARYWLHFFRRNRERLGLASVDRRPRTRLGGHSGRGTRSFPGCGQPA